ncbi:MAG: glycosyl transferase family 2, partial [Caulobacteraceae bacterium]|nr:glycosyl transferase family 2 [Caulobacteraceae bacterium]
NVQHIQLIRNKTFHPMNRSHFFMGVMAYLTPPLCLVYLMVGALYDAQRGIQDVIANGASAMTKAAHFHISLNAPQAALLALTFAMVLGPKFLGLMRMLSDEASVRSFGGKAMLMRGFAVEIFMSVLVAPVIMLAQSRALLEILLRRDAGWQPQNRSAEGGTSLKDCARLHGWQSLLGLVLVAALATSPASLVLMIPILTGLSFAVLLAWALDHRRFGQAFREMGLLVTAEERRAPDIIRAADMATAPMVEEVRWQPMTVASAAAL